VVCGVCIAPGRNAAPHARVTPGTVKAASRLRELLTRPAAPARERSDRLLAAGHMRCVSPVPMPRALSRGRCALSARCYDVLSARLSRVVIGRAYQPGATPKAAHRWFRSQLLWRAGAEEKGRV